MGEISNQIDIVKKHIKRYPDFPKPGIVFLDIFSVLSDAKAFHVLQELLANHVRQLKGVEVVAGLESRGFLFGPSLALAFGLPFVPIRKKGKLPGKVKQVSFSLEYGDDVFEVQVDSIKPKQKVLLIDDLLATGGSMAASCKLITEMDAEVIECLVVIEIPALKGREIVPAHIHSLIQETDA